MIGIKHRVNQATLRESIRYIGIGLHTGRSVAMRVRPGEADTGIRFLRKDVPQGQGIVSAVWQNVIDTELCTVIGNEHGVSVRSIEHLMAALRGCGVDNALVELDGPELPVMDGSAKPFVAMIERAGIARQSAAR
ncbi:MAG: UDP-3-O-acyl-N-acetylglucosamine deacetylase, partial [Acidiferrobacterales bacterium]